MQITDFAAFWNEEMDSMFAAVVRTHAPAAHACFPESHEFCMVNRRMRARMV